MAYPAVPRSLLPPSFVHWHSRAPISAAAEVVFMGASARFGSHRPNGFLGDSAHLPDKRTVGEPRDRRCARGGIGLAHSSSHEGSARIQSRSLTIASSGMVLVSEP